MERLREPESKVFNCDCIEYMHSLPDNYFDLIIADPPYGGGNDEQLGARNRFHKGGVFEKYHQPTDSAEEHRQHDTSYQSCTQREICEIRTGQKVPKWDITPLQEYFDELMRVSKEQIIWGGNYFSLPPTRCFLVWKKHIPETFSMAMCEYAWTSFKGNAKLFEFPSTRKEYSGKFHPTEKPIELYQWILKNYAKEGDKMFDPNMGSQNSRLAAYSLGFDYCGCEINTYYFDKGNENFDKIVRGIIKGKNGKEYIQQSLF